MNEIILFNISSKKILIIIKLEFNLLLITGQRLLIPYRTLFYTFDLVNVLFL